MDEPGEKQEEEKRGDCAHCQRDRQADDGDGGDNRQRGTYRAEADQARDPENHERDVYCAAAYAQSASSGKLRRSMAGSC